MTNCELMWAAGIFEGEGNFHLTKHRYPSPQAKVKMKDRDVIERFHAAIGLGSVYFEARVQEGWSDMWYWRVTGWKSVVHFIDLIGPYLGARRREQFSAILEAAPDPLPTYAPRGLSRA